MTDKTEALGEALYGLSARLLLDHFFEVEANHAAYEKVVAAFTVLSASMTDKTDSAALDEIYAILSRLPAAPWRVRKSMLAGFGGSLEADNAHNFGNIAHFRHYETASAMADLIRSITTIRPDKTDSAALIAGDAERVVVSQRAREFAAEACRHFYPGLIEAGDAVKTGAADGHPVAQMFARFEHETRLAGERAGMLRAAGIVADMIFVRSAEFDSLPRQDSKLADEIITRLTILKNAEDAIRAQAGEAS